VLIVDGSTIKGFTGAGVGGIRWTYASASNFATATSGQVNSLGTGGVVSDLAVYPRTFTAAGL
jgi:vacuolar-type H+-ATPase subunit F/Vma7